jgi:hypothetical protein
MSTSGKQKKTMVRAGIVTVINIILGNTARFTVILSSCIVVLDICFEFMALTNIHSHLHSYWKDGCIYSAILKFIVLSFDSCL